MAAQKVEATENTGGGGSQWATNTGEAVASPDGNPIETQESGQTPSLADQGTENDPKS